MKRFPGHLVASDRSNVGFWTLQCISGHSSRPLEARLDPWKATGEFLNLQNEEEIFSLKKSWKDFLAIWWLLTPQMCDFGLFNSFLDPQVVLRKRIWTPGRLQDSLTCQWPHIICKILVPSTNFWIQCVFSYKKQITSALRRYATEPSSLAFTHQQWAIPNLKQHLPRENSRQVKLGVKTYIKCRINSALHASASHPSKMQIW